MRSLPIPPVRWWVIAGGQDRIITRGQLLGGGCTRGHLDAQVTGGRWRKLSFELYVLHNGPLTENQQWWAATLAVGPLAGRTALQAHGLTGWPAAAVEVMVSRGARPVILSGITLKVRESRRFSRLDVHPAGTPARVRVERAAIDAAAWSKSPRAACGLLAAVVQQRLTVAPRLRTALQAAGSVRHVHLLRIVLDDIEGGAQAMSEVDLDGVCRRYGLEPPERQLVRLDGAGRRRYVDARVRAPGGRSVLVEIDGALHLLVRSYWDDMARGNELVISGERVLRFASVALHIDEARVGNQLRRACGLDALAAPIAA